MTTENSRGTSSSPSPTSRLADAGLIAAVIGLIVILGVSFMNMRELRRLSARVSYLETLRTPPTQPGPDPNKIYTIEVASAPAKGPATAPVTIAAFSEFECPFCLSATPVLEQVEETYKDKVRIVWKHLPLTSIHAHAMGASIASEAARKQGKFWEYHDRLFANQKQLGPDDLKRYAQELGLDVARFEKDIADPELKKKVEADMAEARALTIRSTPSFFINGRFVRGAVPFETFSLIIDEELMKLDAAKGPSN
jgi:protein-disulfide isomerase